MAPTHGQGGTTMSRLLLLGGLVVPVLTLVLIASSRRQDMTVRREWRLVQAVRVIGLLGGAAAGAALLGPEPLWPSVTDLGRGVLLAPAVFGLVVLVAAAVGETVVRPPTPSGARRASLRPRRVLDYLPRRLTQLVAAMGAALAATLVVTVATASPDDMGRAGRALSCVAGNVGQGRSPYPGSFYALPLAVVLALVVGVSALSARQAVLRPRGLAETERGDDELRRQSVTVVVAATGVALGATLTGIAFGAGLALTGLDVCGASWMQPFGAALLVVAPAAGLAACWCLALLLVGDLSRRR